MWKARASRDQCDAGTPTSAGLGVARTKTRWRSSGGKSGRAAAAGQVGQAGQAPPPEAAAPLGDGVGVAAQFSGDVVVAGDAGVEAGVAAEDEAGAEGEGLGGGGGVGQAAEVEDLVGGQVDAGALASHGGRSFRWGGGGVDAWGRGSHEARSLRWGGEAEPGPGQGSRRRTVAQALKRPRLSTLPRWSCETQV